MDLSHLGQGQVGTPWSAPLAPNSPQPRLPTSGFRGTWALDKF